MPSTLTSIQPLDAARVLVEYEFAPGEAEGKPGSSWDGPATRARVTATRVAIWGYTPQNAGFDWVSAGLFSREVVDLWEEAILNEELSP